MKYLIFITILLANCIFSPVALAAAECKVTGGNWVVNGSIRFDPDAPTGTESEAINSSGNYHMECTNDDTKSHDVIINFTSSLPVANNGSGIFATGTLGVGAKLFINVTNAVGFNSYCMFNDWQLIFNNAATMCTMMGDSTASLDITGYVKFVKLTESLAGGVITTIPEMKTNINISNIAGNTPGPDLWNGESNVVMDGIACKVNGGNIAVPIGNFNSTDFQQPGFTTGEAAFDIGLTCDPGANINVTLRGKQNPDTSNTSVLALSDSDGDAAQGVGVQILYEDKPLTIDEKFPLKQSEGGDERLSFAARYYQTKTQVTAGTANTVATLDLTYQ
ncbi:fimbrial protein [Siccibacter colletis]|uniref:fimbrial protein n=1 Tax=Siccibacter colletis TaxID=1505757 RepID=UPI003CEA7672